MAKTFQKVTWYAFFLLNF
jgi:brefeldin A-resistance guanine nucleotide exchange factor 1